MVLKSGTIIPFQHKDTKKLLKVPGKEEKGYLTVTDIKDAVLFAFSVCNFKFYNKKIGFHIPDDLLVPYLEQRHDLTNFIVEVIVDENTPAPAISKRTQSEKAHQPTKDVQQQSVEETQLSDPTVATPVEMETPLTIPNEQKRPRESLNDSVSATKKFREFADPVDNYIESILETSEGQLVCQNYSTSNEMDDKDRLNLIKMVTNFEFQNILISGGPLAIDSNRCIELATAIVRKFPNEYSVSYYVAFSKNLKRMPGGGLWEQFYDMKCRYLQIEGFNRYTNPGTNIDDDFPELSNLLELYEDWISYRKSWQQVFDSRMLYVRHIPEPFDYFVNFIGSQGENAFELIESDFERLYPGKSVNMLNYWSQLSDRIFTEAIISCRSDVPLILNMYGNMSELSGFMMLSYFVENYESDVVPFEKDDVTNLIIHIDDDDGDAVEACKEYCSRQTEARPMIFVSGSTPEELYYYVIIGESVICMESAIRAVDFCFKCYHVLQMAYFRPQAQTWQVIQRALFGINMDRDDPSIDSFLNMFRS